MHHFPVVALLLLLSNGCWADEAPELNISKTLVKLAVIFRHGDRSLHDVGGAGGSAQLTTIGARHMYDLGQFYRKRYKSFLTDNISEIQAKSIALNRCLTSIECVLAALYPPNNESKIEPDLDWQPIPVLMEPLETDAVLFPESYCPVATNDRSQRKVLPYFKQVNAENKEFMQFLSEKSGTNITTFVQISHLQDDILVKKIHNMSVEDWVTDEIYEKMESFTDLWYTWETDTFIQQKFRAGPFLKEILQVLPKNESQPIITGAQSDEDEAPHKFYLYCSKRFNMAALLRALGSFNNRSALAGDSVIFELHEWDDKRYLRVYHLNDTDTKTLYPLVVRGCSSHDCLWDDFVQAIQPYIPQDFDQECAEPSTESSANHNLYTDFPPVYFFYDSLPPES